MAIKTVGGMSDILVNNGAREWSRIADREAKIDLESGRIGVNEGIDKAQKTFGEFLKDSVAQVNGLQQEANVAMEKLASGQSQNLHETLLAVEQADTAFRAMNQIRTKVIDAYREIMKMQV